MDRLWLLVSILAIGYFGFDKFALAPRREAVLVTQTTALLRETLRGEAMTWPDRRTQASRPAGGSFCVSLF